MLALYKTATDFSWKVFEMMLKGNSYNSNIVVSPFSLLHLLGILVSETEIESKVVLKNVEYESNGNEFANMVSDFSKRIESSTFGTNAVEEACLNTFLFYDKNCESSSTPRGRTTRLFNAKSHPINFNDLPKSMSEINALISEATNGMIPDYINNMMDLRTSLVINTLYLEKEWNNKFTSFDKENFSAENGDFLVDMMEQEEEFYAYENEQFQAIQMSYKKSMCSFIAVLPKDGVSLSEIQQYLAKDDNLCSLVSKMDRFLVDLKIPKFSIEKDFELTGLLKEIVDVTRTNTEASTVESESKTNVLSLRKTSQRLVFSIDEIGTKAVSVTGTVFVDGCRKLSKMRMHFNRPFFYCLSKLLRVDSDYQYREFPLIMGTYVTPKRN